MTNIFSDDNKDKAALTSARNQAEEALADAPDTELVDQDEKDEQLEDGNRLAHVSDENKSVHDRQLAQASSVEQASSTKDRFHRPEDRKEKSEQMEFVAAERTVNEFHLHAPVIKSSQFEFVGFSESSV
jgi:flagellar biosynthesis GTPase FlhF